MVDVDYSQRYGLVAVRGTGDDVVAQGNYFGIEPGQAEVAFTIAQRLQGLGLGTLLLAHLAEVAEESGISLFVAEVLPGEPPDDRSLSGERLPDRDVVAARHDPRGAPDLVLGRGCLPLRRP